MHLKYTQIWGIIIMSSMVSACFVTALVFAYIHKDQGNINMLVGAIVAQFTMVVGFWVGSSIGSQKKDEIIAASAPPKDGI